MVDDTVLPKIKGLRPEQCMMRCIQMMRFSSYHCSDCEERVGVSDQMTFTDYCRSAPCGALIQVAAFLFDHKEHRLSADFLPETAERSQPVEGA